MVPYQTKSPLVAFLYELLRDHVTAGVLEKILTDPCLKAGGPNMSWTLSNGYLAAYAEDVANRLTQHSGSDPTAVEIHAKWRAWLNQMSEVFRREGQISESYAVAFCASNDVGPDNPDE